VRRNLRHCPFGPTNFAIEQRRRFIVMISQAIRNNPWKTLGVTGLVASSIYRRRKEEARRMEDAKKKKVLVLPFYRMKVVEEKSPTSLSSLGAGNPQSGREKTIEMPADELVNLIHEAAQDPSIVGLYGVFGNGGTFSTGGWAHLEEVRNAIRVFGTSHRTHKEPGVETPPPRDRKALYAYSNTFANPMGSTQSMQDFFVATAFSKIHMQPQGDLNLFGLHATNAFFRDFLHKYGITVHVWKHGEYKNMANRFTHSHFTKEHYENVAGILLPIHQHVCDAIYTSRHKQLRNFAPAKFWSMVENAGSLPAHVAHQIGFVDYLPRIDPLDALIKNNKQKAEDDSKGTSSSPTKGMETKKEDLEGVENRKNNPKNSTLSSKSKEEESKNQEECFAEKWKFETDLDHFKADSKISIEEYARRKTLERQKEAKEWKFYQSLQDMSESSVVMKGVLSLMGYSAPYFNIPKEKFSEAKAKGLKEKIAVVKINGAIGEATARKAEKALRKIKEQEDIKCVVLRVDSPGGSINACETIYQEIQDLPQKVVVSFGNVSASGGYYISANAERIFASPTTITGSIGVVMLRMDFRALAKQYGITFDSIPTSSLSGSFDPFYPMNQQMNENFLNGADRAYHRFKSLVSSGRDLEMEAVEAIAKGRVFSGEQAQQFGLVDELGGLDRAVAYAQRNLTTSGAAQVVQWPPKKSLVDFLMGRGKGDDEDDLENVELPNVVHVALNNFFGEFRLLRNSPWLRISSFSASSGSENEANAISPGSFAPVPLVTSGVMLTADENTAIQCLLEDNDIPQAKFLSRIPSLFGK